MDLYLNITSSKRLLYLISINLLVFYALKILNPSQSYWFVWTSLLLSLLITGHTFWQRTLVIFTTGYLIALAVYFAGTFHEASWQLIVLLTALTLISTWISQHHPKFFIACFIFNIMLIFAALLPPPPAENSIRFNCILLGMLIPLLFHLIFLPNYFQNEMQYAFTQSIYQLKRLNKEIFSCFIDPGYKLNLYLYERRLHIQKNYVIQWLDRMRILNIKPHPEWDTCLVKLDTLFDNTLDYAQLRRRVSDYSTLELCTQETTALMKAIDQIYKAFLHSSRLKQVPALLNTLSEKTQRFEETYHNVLQISASEPVVFLLFLASVRLLQTELTDFYNKLTLDNAWIM